MKKHLSLVSRIWAAISVCLICVVALGLTSSQAFATAAMTGGGEGGNGVATASLVLGGGSTMSVEKGSYIIQSKADIEDCEGATLQASGEGFWQQLAKQIGIDGAKLAKGFQSNQIKSADSGNSLRPGAFYAVARGQGLILDSVSWTI